MAILPDGTPFANHGVLIVTTEANTLAEAWRNTIDLVWATGSMPIYGDPVISAWVNFLQGIQRDDCTIIKVALFPFVKGRQPLSSQGAFWEQTTSIACKNWGAGTAHPPASSSLTPPLGEVCVSFIKGKFGPGGGREGRMFLRNSVPQEAMKNTAGGPPALDPVSSGTTVAEWNTWALNELGTFCTASPLPRFCLIHAQKLTQTPPAHDVFDSEVSVPVFQRLTTNNIRRSNKR